MGVRSVLKTDPVRLLRAQVDSREEVLRVMRSRSRRLMLEDNGEQVIKQVINKTFTDATVKSRVFAYASMARSCALFKRIVHELARPIYIVPPVRSVTPDDDQRRFDAIANTGKLDVVMDNATRLAIAQNTAFVMARYGGERLDRLVLQVIPADTSHVIPDPEDPLEPLGFAYDYQVLLRDGSAVIWRNYWDDEETWSVDHNGNLATPIVRHELGRIPVTAIHAAPRYSEFWNMTSGDDMVEGDNACSLLTMLSVRKLKARGFRQLVLQGDMVAFPKSQVWDEESAIMAPEGSSVIELGQEADAANYMAMIDSITRTVAANHGISRARLNQESTGTASDIGLMEQRAELLKVTRYAEQDLFEVIKVVSRAFGDDRTLSAEATMKSIDYGEVTQRTDPQTDLAVWETKRRRGIANVLDQIKYENPEIRTNAEAWEELERNLEAESQYVRRIRELNMPMNADVENPGKTPEENGADGGRMNGDGDEPSDDMLMEALNGAQ